MILSGSSDAEPPIADAWKRRLVELVGAVVLIASLATFVGGVVIVFLLHDTARLAGLPVSAGGWSAFRLGWRLLMRPDDPWS